MTNWHPGRIMRTGIGIMMLVMAIQSRDWAIGLFSAFFLYQGITDTGCCSAQGCYAPKRSDTAEDRTNAGGAEIEYEEVK